MDRAMQRRGTAGLSLVELLVVLAIIGVISAVLIPVAIQGGWFTSSKSAFAARELFTLEKAARVYASTFNVETTVAYGVELIPDTQLADSRLIPVVTEVALARRLKREEIIQLNIGGATLDLNGDYFVPLSAADGVFRAMPKQMCILPDLFEVDDLATPDSKRGLTSVQLYDVYSTEPDPNDRFLEPRYYDFGSGVEPLNYTYSVGAPVPNFPAHRFLPDGSIRTSDAFTKQRFHIRVGARPDATFKDRFTVSSDAVPIESPMGQLPPPGLPPLGPALFNDNLDPALPPIIYYDAENFNSEIDTVLEFFVPTGRVTMQP